MVGTERTGSPECFIVHSFLTAIPSEGEASDAQISVIEMGGKVSFEELTNDDMDAGNGVV